MKYFLRKILSIILWHSPLPRLSDFILWPLTKRIFGNYSEVVKINKQIPIKVYGDMADMVNKNLLFFSEYVPFPWEPSTSSLVRDLIPHKKVVVIAGAHIGYYPLMVGFLNPQVQVYAFEPNPVNFQRLNDNVRELKNIHTSHLALGDKKGEEMMYFDFGQSSLVETNREHDGMGKVQIDTLDAYFEGKPEVPDLLILDAEGYEGFILRGAEKMLKNNRPDIIFELNNKALNAAGTGDKELCDYIKSFGYKISYIEDDHLKNTKVSFTNAYASIGK